MERVIVYPFVAIGRGAIIWGSGGIGPFSRIGDHTWIVGPRLGESVTVGDHCFIGANATISSFTTVGKSNVIGAGAVDSQEHEGLRGLQGPCEQSLTDTELPAAASLTRQGHCRRFE